MSISFVYAVLKCNIVGLIFVWFLIMSIFSGKKSKLCKEHDVLKDTVQENTTDSEVSYRPRTRAFAKACL